MVWTRFRKHHLATFGGGFLLLMIVLCFIGAPIYSAATGYGLSTQNLPNRYAFPT